MCSGRFGLTCVYRGQALKLIHTACTTLQELRECPAEIVIGFYYLLGFVFERKNDYRRAIRAFETSLDIMERVYGTRSTLSPILSPLRA